MNKERKVLNALKTELEKKIDVSILNNASRDFIYGLIEARAAVVDMICRLIQDEIDEIMKKAGVYNG